MTSVQIVKTLASGSYGRVELVTAEDGQELACKIISKSNPMYVKQRVIDEVKAGKTLNHTNIAKVHDHTEDDENDYILMDYVCGHDLLAYMQENEMSELDIRKIFEQICNAVKHAHDCGIFHRDLKLENIMIDKSGKVTLIDFGLCFITDAKDKEETLSSDWCGTLEYAAPEVVLHIPYKSSLSDVWSLGIVLYALLYGKFPFTNQQRRGIRRYSAHPKLSFPVDNSDECPYEVSSSVKELLEKLLVADPSQRISIDEVLQHPWVTGKAFPAASAAC